MTSLTSFSEIMEQAIELKVELNFIQKKLDKFNCEQEILGKDLARMSREANAIGEEMKRLRELAAEIMPEKAAA